MSERSFDDSPARVFTAWADPAAKACWDLLDDGWVIAEDHDDFWIGGRAFRRFGPSGRPSISDRRGSTRRQTMPERSVTHATFAVERSYDASPARVFAAWADPASKARWFAGPEDWDASGHELDFQVGGREFASGGPRGGPVHIYNAIYYDIVPDERIVYAYDMHLDQTRISVSLATVEIKPAGTGTRLTFTEQGAFLDGHDYPAEREQGTIELLDALDAELRRGSVGD